MNKKVKKGLKITGITLGSIIGVLALAVGSYVGYVFGSYYRIEDNQVLEINKNTSKDQIELNKELKYTSYNIGFGAYSPNFDFFLDHGIDEDGTLLTGHHSKGLSKEDVMKNTNGSIDTMKKLSSDFYAVQEADVKSNRAYKINQKAKIEESFNNMDSTFALNFHSAFLAYPFYDMHGKSDAGLLTLSNYKIQESVRHSLTISEKFDKFFDLDRCFSANYINVANGKQLCLINIHMSAYDEGGYIRNTQIKEINEFINKEYEKGNYILSAGDYNHDLLTNNPLYTYTEEHPCFRETYKQQIPTWVSRMFKADKVSPFGKHFSVRAADNAPSLRGCDRPYKDGYTYVNTVDGFIVSDNIEVINIETTNVADETSPKFAYSDHQPTTLTFKLK